MGPTLAWDTLVPVLRTNLMWKNWYPLGHKEKNTQPNSSGKLISFSLWVLFTGRFLLHPWNHLVTKKIQKENPCHQNSNGPRSVSCYRAMIDTQVFSGSVKRRSCGSDFLEPHHSICHVFFFVISLKITKKTYAACLEIFPFYGSPACNFTGIRLCIFATGSKRWTCRACQLNLEGSWFPRFHWRGGKLTAGTPKWRWLEDDHPFEVGDF